MFHVTAIDILYLFSVYRCYVVYDGQVHSPGFLWIKQEHEIGEEKTS